MKKIVESYLEFLQAAAIAQDGRAATVYDANPKKMNRESKLAEIAHKYASSHRRRPQNHR